MTLHDKKIELANLQLKQRQSLFEFYYPQKNVKEAVKELIKEIENIEYQDIPEQTINISSLYFIIKEIFGEGLLVEQSSTILEDSHPLGIHSPQSVATTLSTASSGAVDTNQNSEDKK